MRCEPTRRSFMAGIGAAATAGAVGSPIALARDEPAYRTAGELVEALAGKEVSSRELVDAAISRIERIDPKINSVVVRDFERAREAAVAADAALAKGERRPLLGLPMTVKEQFNVVGMPTSWGDPQFWRWYPATDTLAVQRLKNAGQALFHEVDVVLCPPMPTVAFPHDHSPKFARILDVDGAKVPYFDQTVWAGIATLNGLPATIAPIDRTAHGLPIGAQIIGGFLDDRTTIAFAGLIEREFGGFTPPPGF